MLRVHLATLPKTIDEALGKAPNQPDRTGPPFQQQRPGAVSIRGKTEQLSLHSVSISAFSHRQEVVIAKQLLRNSASRCAA